MFEEYRKDTNLELDRKSQRDDANNKDKVKNVDAFSYILFLEAQFQSDDLRQAE